MGVRKVTIGKAADKKTGVYESVSKRIQTYFEETSKIQDGGQLKNRIYSLYFACPTVTLFLSPSPPPLFLTLSSSPLSLSPTPPPLHPHPHHRHHYHHHHHNGHHQQQQQYCHSLSYHFKVVIR